MKRRQFLIRGVAAAAAMTLAPDTLARRLGGTPIALVTADKEAHIVAVDLFATRIIGRIRTLPAPRSIETIAGSAALVCHTTEGAVSLIDPVSMTVARVIHGFGEPRYTAAHPTGRYAYISDSGRHEIVTLDVDLGRIVHRTPVPGPARHISHDPVNPRLWTALGSKAQHVALLDTSEPGKPNLITTVRPPFLAHDVVFDPTGAHAWISSGDSHAVCIYSSAHARQIRLLHADAPPQHISFHARHAYITSGNDGTLRTHDTTSARQLAQTRIPGGSFNVTDGWQRIATPSLQRGTLALLDHNGRHLTTLTVARSAHDATILAA
jgi:hypothetical protein